MIHHLRAGLVPLSLERIGDERCELVLGAIPKLSPPCHLEGGLVEDYHKHIHRAVASSPVVGGDKK